MSVSRSLSLALASTLACSPALAAVVDWRNISTMSGFGNWREELRRAADEDGHVRVNHFCVVVRIARGKDGPDNKAFVYWREGRSIQAYGQTSYDMSPATESGGDYIDLRHDVVASEIEINGSISRVTRAYVKQIRDSCARIGTSLTVVRHVGTGKH